MRKPSGNMKKQLSSMVLEGICRMGNNYEGGVGDDPS